MQMHAHVAGRDRQCSDGFANDADDLRRIGLQFAALDLPRHGHRERQHLVLYLRIERLERLRQVVEHAGQPVVT